MLLLTTLMFAQAAVATPASAIGSKTNLAPTAKVECRLVEEAGSRIPTRVCRLDKEWELLAQDAQNDLRTSRNKVTGDNANTR